MPAAATECARRRTTSRARSRRSPPCFFAPPWVMLIFEEVVPYQGVVQERLESGVQEARLAQIERTTLELAGKCGGIFQRSDVFLPGPPGLAGLARTLLVWTLRYLLSKRNMREGT